MVGMSSAPRPPAKPRKLTVISAGDDSFLKEATIAAGALPNRIGFLAGWVVDAERIKPGAGMPVNNIDSSELQSLLSFLRTLR